MRGDEKGEDGRDEAGCELTEEWIDLDDPERGIGMNLRRGDLVTLSGLLIGF